MTKNFLFPGEHTAWNGETKARKTDIKATYA